MSITVNVDISKALRKLAIAKEQIPFATALALTRTAQEAKKDLQDAMRSSFTNPRRFTINSLTIQRATKQSLSARIFVRSKGVENALKSEIFGGVRDRAIEKFLGDVLPSGMFAVPTGNAKRGADGKVSISWLRQIMQKLGYSAGATVTKRRRRTASTIAYFLLAAAYGRLKPGIYQRDGRKASMLIAFTSQPHYAPRYDFFGIGERSIRTNFPAQFKRAVAAATRTAR